jgi:hypothetical protein
MLILLFQGSTWTSPLTPLQTERGTAEIEDITITPRKYSRIF